MLARSQPRPGPRPGLVGTASLRRVEAADLAPSLGSGDVAVLGTPRLIALVEAAAVAALAASLPAGSTTVGTAVRVRHLAPTLEGGTAAATATLARVDGRTLLFRVEVVDGAGLVADGEHERMVVDRERFLARARARQPTSRAP